MSPIPSSPLNPSQAVERIREIIVGRHLEKLEARVVRLESGSPQHGHLPSQWEDRLCTSEARLEALQQSVQRLADASREESEIHHQRHREEIQRLASQIQQVAAIKSADTSQAAVAQMESKIGTWLASWQGSLQTHLNDRESKIANQLRHEVASLWENTESQITRLQSRMIDRDTVEERFSRIAAAARALAESASPATSGTANATP